MAIVWILLVMKLGVWRATKAPSEGVLSYTYDGWAETPAGKHLFLGQYLGTEFAGGEAYVSYTYPFLLANFAIVEPVHRLLHLPYSVAHNVLPYVHAIGLILLLGAVTSAPLPALRIPGASVRWLITFVAVGLLATTPLVWVAQLNYNRDNFHVLAAAVFCSLSVFAFRSTLPGTWWLIAGVFLAMWSPIYIPAWILAGLFLTQRLVIDRRWLLQVATVSALAMLNIALPRLIGTAFGIVTHGNGFAFRSGLDGSTVYMTSILQAVLSPDVSRPWSTGLYVIAAAVGAVIVHYCWRSLPSDRPLDQAWFLVIPYATIAILLPQFTSIHPYFTDVLLVVPATFLVAFWSLQSAFVDRLSGRSFVVWLLAIGGLLMTNLLTIAQQLR